MDLFSHRRPRHITYPGLDRPVRTPLLTPAFSIKNTKATALALKAGLGLELCYVLMYASPYRHLRFTKPQSAAATRGLGTVPFSNQRTRQRRSS